MNPIFTLIFLTATATALSAGTVHNHDRVTVPGNSIITHDHAFGSPLADATTCMKRLADGRYVLGGSTSSDLFNTGTKTTADEDGFIAIVSADFKTIEAAAYIGGSKSDRVLDVAVAEGPTFYVVGRTESADLPVHAGQFGATMNGTVDGFLLKYSLTSGGLQPKSGMFVGGPGTTIASGVAVTTIGTIVIAGTTNTRNPFPALTMGDDTANGNTDGFVYIVNNSMLYAEFFSFLGGSQNDAIAKVALDTQNAIFVCGTTSSQDYYTYPKKIKIGSDGGGDGGDVKGGGGGGSEEIGKNPYSHIFNGGTSDVFVAKFTSAGNLEFSTYFGGSGNDEAADMFIDSDGAATVVGTTTSPNLPTQTSATTYSGMADGFIATITADGLRLSGAAYFGGSGNDVVAAAVQRSDKVGAIVGTTTSADFPVRGIGVVPFIGEGGPFLVLASVSEVPFSTAVNITNSSTRIPVSVTVDADSDIIITGNELHGNTEAGDNTSDIFEAKWTFGALTYQSPLPTESLCSGNTVTVRWTVQGIDAQQRYNVEFSSDAGETWANVALNVNSKSVTHTLPALLPADARCAYRVTTTRGHHAVTPSPLTVGVTPVITANPEDSWPCVNTAVTLTVETNDPTATIQWRRDATPIQGATTAILTINNFTADNNGSYDAVVTNACGHITSDAAQLTATTQPLIEQQPQSVAADLNSPVTLSVIARGSNLHYQWNHDGAAIAGATQAAYSVEAVTQSDAGEYTCTITSDCGTTTSQPASVTINGISEVWEGAMAGAIHTWPVPAAQNVSLSLPELAGPVTIMIYTPHGSLVQNIGIGGSTEPQVVSLPVSNLSAGYYHLVVRNSTQTMVAPLIIAR